LNASPLEGTVVSLAYANPNFYVKPADQLGKNDNTKLSWSARAVAVGSVGTGIYNAGTTKCTIPAIPKYDGNNEKAAEEIATGAGFT
jgi:hypothetical protein